MDSDATEKELLHADIARANLLRMRGDYKGAVDQCLSVLKRIPDDGDTHTLLGDIYAEQGNLEESVQWYEMALDLNPRSNPDRAKLSQVRHRLKEREAASAVEQLGLPTEKPNMILIGGVALVVIAALGIGAYMLGQQARGAGAKVSTRVLPISAPLDAPATNVVPETSDIDAPKNIPDTAMSSSGGPQEDVTLTQLITQRSTEGSHLLSAIADPRSKVITLTFAVRLNDDERRIGAELAKTALEQAPDSQLVVLRGSKGEKLAFVADVGRSRLQETETDEWRQANSSEAWVSHVLVNEWPGATAASAPTSGP